MDILLCVSGYGKPYEDGVPKNRKNDLNTTTNSNDYWETVYENLNKRFSKPAAAMEAILMMREKGKNGVPAEICGIIEKAIRLAEEK